MFRDLRLIFWRSVYYVFCFINVYQENKFSNEKVDIKVFVDSITVILQITEKVEGEDVNSQVNKGNDNFYLGDDRKQ